MTGIYPGTEKNSRDSSGFLRDNFLKKGQLYIIYIKVLIYIYIYYIILLIIYIYVRYNSYIISNISNIL